MSRVLAYVPETSFDDSRAPNRRENPIYTAMTAYVGRLGVDQLRSDNYVRPPATVLDAGKLLSAGDHLIIRSLGDISPRASVQATTIFALLNRGVSVHHLTLGPLDQHLSVLREVWASVRPVEEEADSLKARLTTKDTQLEEDMQLFEVEVTKKVAEKFGIKGLIAKEHDEDAAKVGTFVRVERTRRGKTQEQLADHVGTVKSQISIMENGGHSPHLPAVLSYFASNAATLQVQLNNGQVPEAGLRP